MPQGGVDPGEDTWEAAKRELYEETSVRSVEKLGEVADWLIYDIPRTVAGRTWKGRYRGQRQKWFALRFTCNEAAMRELWEETGVTNADYLGETDWLTYEFPPLAVPPSHRLAKFRGQRQKWFALRFEGCDDEIDPLTPRNGQPAEFDTWRWERLDRVPDLVVPFRREVYRKVAESFARFARA